MGVRFPPKIVRLTFPERLKRYPPILVRLLTIYGVRPNRWCPTDHEIASAAGLSIAEVKRISYSLTWDMPVPHMFAFLNGCRIDLENRRTFRRLEWMRKSGYFRHLHKSPLWPTQFQDMVQVWISSSNE